MAVTAIAGSRRCCSERVGMWDRTECSGSGGGRAEAGEAEATRPAVAERRSCVRLRPEHANHVWSYDFVSAFTHDGRTLRLP